jgi:hypothetical protein
MNHHEVVKRYAQRKTNARSGDVTWKGGNISCRGDFVYSYHWWEMAKHLGEKNGEPFFIKNGDRYSPSTSQHQGHVQQLCKGPTVSRTAVDAAGISFLSITQKDIVDYTQDYTSPTLFREKQTGEYYEPKTDLHQDSNGHWRNSTIDYVVFKPPRQGMFIEYHNTKPEDSERFSAEGYWHVLGGVLLGRDGKNFLCSLDENSYFVSQLSEPVGTVEEAFESLKPQSVKKAIKKGLDVKRQGEWFFVPTGMDDSKMAGNLGINKTRLRKIARQKELPTRDNRTNSHRAILLVGNPQIVELTERKKQIEDELSQLHKEYTDRFLAEIESEFDFDEQFSVNRARELMPDRYAEMAKQHQSSYCDYQEKLWNESNEIDRQVKEIYATGKVYVRGTVYHSGREHQSLKLGDEWHEAHMNTEIQSWSASGSFD